MNKILFSDDFSKFPVGKFPSNYYATQEYHYLPPEGYTGNLYESVISYKWRPCNAAWIIVEDQGKKYLLSTLESNIPYNRILVTGDPLWSDYEIKVSLRKLNLSGYAGFVFRYKNSREFYAILLDESNKIKLVKVNHEENIVLKEVSYNYDNKTFYELKVDVKHSQIKGFINNNELFSVNDTLYKTGRVGLIALTTCFFDFIEIATDVKNYDLFINTKDKNEKQILEEREKYPKPKLWKKISTKGFGAGRQLRFGYLRNKKDNLDILIAQNIKLQPEKDDYTAIRALTVIDLSGNILWQNGEAEDSFDAAVTTCDLPVQIYDIDNDGKDEVIYAKNFKLYILNGQNGNIKNMAFLPNNVVTEDRYGFLNPDAIIIANLRGNKKPQDIIIKNRYHQLWAFDNKLNLLWSSVRPEGKYTSNTGHFPAVFDFNKDGNDEIFCGYTLFDNKGNVIWNNDLSDHTDEIIVGCFNPDIDEVQIATASGDEGFCIFDSPTGKIIHKDKLGHAQRISAAKFRADLPGLQFYVITFWHHSGIISFHTCTGKKLFSFEPTSLGNILSPVNWTGEGTELALLNSNVKNGGLIDGYGRKVVLFPDDGHPDLCCEAIDLTGDARSEIITWDKDSIWIYTQDREFIGNKIYEPVRLPHYNNSNYRGEISF